jgi:cytochrome P450
MSGQNTNRVIPTHVSKDLLVDFDIYTDDRMRHNPHLGLKALHSVAPDIFFTPLNGGHWVVTRFELMNRILPDTEHFSNSELDIPRSYSTNRMIPLNLDPPDHLPFRIVLMRHFDKRSITAMEEKLHGWAAQLIDQVLADGACDFTETLGAGFPVSVFMEMMGMPLERIDEFRSIALEYFGKTTIERRLELQRIIIDTMGELIEARRLERRADLISKLLDEQIRGRSLTPDELRSISFLLFIAGLDTVANALTFAFRNLAADRALQDQLVADSSLIPAFVEESLRRFAVVNQTRIVKKDLDIGTARFREGDMVLCPLALAGLDERANPNPERFDLQRDDRKHIAFSIGVHVCIGNILARAEMRVFTEEWLKRIPRFRMRKDAHLEWRAGLVMALMHLPLEWNPVRSDGDSGRECRL